MAEELMRIAYHRSDNLVADSERIIETAQGNAYQAVNLLLVERNWLLGIEKGGRKQQLLFNALKAPGDETGFEELLSRRRLLRHGEIY